MLRALDPGSARHLANSATQPGTSTSRSSDCGQKPGTSPGTCTLQQTAAASTATRPASTELSALLRGGSPHGARAPSEWRRPPHVVRRTSDKAFKTHQASLTGLPLLALPSHTSSRRPPAEPDFLGHTACRIHGRLTAACSLWAARERKLAQPGVTSTTEE
jgi:hypothetical protein